MRILSLIAVIASIGLMVLTNMIYSPVLDSPQTSLSTRLLISAVLIVQVYFLLFSTYIAFKVYPIFKWVPDAPKK